MLVGFLVLAGWVFDVAILKSFPPGFLGSVLISSAAVLLLGALGFWYASRLDRSDADRRREEAELRRQAQRMRDIMDGMGPQMFVGLLTPEGVLIEANRSALELAGVQPLDVLGKPLEQTIWFSDAEEEQQRVRQAIERAARGELSRFDITVRAKGNRMAVVDFTLQPLFDESGNVQFLVSSAQDITERKRAEEALREREGQLRLAMVGARLGIGNWDLSTGKMGLSPEWYEMFGFPPNAPLSLEDFLARVHPEDRGRIQRMAEEGAQRGGELDVEYRIVHPDAGVKWIVGRATFFAGPDGKPTHAAGVALDITEHKRAEEGLRKLTDQLLRAQDEERRRIARELHDALGQTAAAALMKLRMLEQSKRLGATEKEELAETIKLVEDAAAEIRTLSHLLHPPLLEELGLEVALRELARGFEERSGVAMRIEAPCEILPLDYEARLCLYIGLPRRR
ncbi:MAG TPA: PAS domain S-box protein [Candidatus Xenobia bacterium]|nr:PAS domain S-box protein [Candidatus Xenobia bacterium]